MKLLIAFVLVLGLIGCGEDNSKKSDKPAAPNGGNLNPADRPQSPQVVFMPNTYLKFSSDYENKINLVSFPVRSSQADEFHMSLLFPSNFHGFISISQGQLNKQNCTSNYADDMKLYFRNANGSWQIEADKVYDVTALLALDIVMTNNSRCGVYDYSFVAQQYKELPPANNSSRAL